MCERRVWLAAVCIMACMPTAGGLRASDPDAMEAAKKALREKQEEYRRELERSVDRAKDRVKKADYFVPVYADPSRFRARDEGLKAAKQGLAAAQGQLAEFYKTGRAPLELIPLAKAKVGDWGELLNVDSAMEVVGPAGKGELAVMLVLYPTRGVLMNRGDGVMVRVGGSAGGRLGPFVLKTQDAALYATGSRITSLPGPWVITRTRKWENDQTVFVLEALEVEKPPPAPTPEPKDKAETAARASSAPAPPDAAEEAERAAARRLKLAKEILEDGRRDKAEAVLQDIIAKYPKTKAAGEAQKLLDK